MFIEVPFIIAQKQLKSRLLIGTGKFSSAQAMKSAIVASGAEIVTTAIRRVDLKNPEDSFISSISPKDYIFLPNTSGARTAEEALKIARIAKATGISNWIKLEVTPEPNYLLPDPIDTLKAAEQLVKEGFIVLPYINADPILAKRLEECGCATVMPLAAPIGSNRGLKTKDQIQLIIQQSNIPVIVDAGIGSPSQAAEAMEMGADAVLVNTAIATATFPTQMANAFKMAVEAGRLAYEAGIPGIQSTAHASSPLTGFLQS
jgi:thiazole synthase